MDNKIISILYERNKDDTFKVTYIAENGMCGKQSLVYPKVTIEWYYPQRVNYYCVPIPDGIKVMNDIYLDD